MQSIRDFLQQKSLTQQQFAALVGLSQPMVSAYLRGKSRPTIETAHRISERSGIPFERIVDDLKPR